jgi:hypothetical protein
VPGVPADLLRLQPQPGSLRAGISVLLPLLVVLALGHPEWSSGDGRRPPRLAPCRC